MDNYITIEKVIIGGIGLGRLPDGKVVLVPGVLPGEHVKFKAVRTRKDFIQARLLEILEPSRHRIKPQCTYCGNCGGCDFQHISSSFQATVKNDIFSSTNISSMASAGWWLFFS